MKALFTVAPAHGAALQGDSAADPETRGAGAGGGAALGRALLGGVAGAVQTVLSSAHVVGELDHAEHVQSCKNRYNVCVKKYLI